MNLTNEQIEQILEGAPDGATHYGYYSEQYRYLKEVSAYIRGEWHSDYDLFVDDTHDLNALREVLTLRKRVAELEAQNNLMRKIVDCVKPNPKKPDGVLIEDADGNEWLHVILELNELTKGVKP